MRLFIPLEVYASNRRLFAGFANAKPEECKLAPDGAGVFVEYPDKENKEKEKGDE